MAIVSTGLAPWLALGLACSRGDEAARPASGSPAAVPEVSDLAGAAATQSVGPPASVKSEDPRARELFTPPGPEPVPGPGPVFGDATADRHGAPLPPGAIARLGSLTGERHLPSASPGTSGTGASAQWFDAAYRKLHARELEDPRQSIFPYRTSDDGKTILVCDYDALSACDVRDVATQRLIASIPALDPTHVGFFRDAWFFGEHVLLHWREMTATAPVDSTMGAPRLPDPLRVHRIADGSLVSEVELPNGTSVFVSEGRVVIANAGDVDLYPVPDLGPPRRMQKSEATGHITWVAFATDAPRLAAYRERSRSGSGPSTLVIWNVETGAVASEVPLSCTGLGLAPDGRTVACADSDPEGAPVFDRTVTIVDAADAHPRQVLRSAQVSGDLAFSADGDRLTTLEGAPVVETWNLADGTAEMLDEGHFAEIEAIAVAPDGEYAAVVDVSGELLVWRLRDQTVRWRRSLPFARGRKLGFSADGATVLIAATRTCMLTAIARANGEPAPCLHPLDPAYRGGNASLAVDGTVAAVKDSEKEEVWLVPLDGGRPRAIPVSELTRGDMIRKGPHHVVAGDTQIELSSGTASPHVELSPRTFAHLRDDLFLIQERRQLAVARAGTKIARRYSLGDVPLSALVGAEDGRVAIADENGTIGVFDPAGRRIARFEHEGGAVTALAFHPTEPVLLSGSVDANVLVWRLAPK